MFIKEIIENKEIRVAVPLTATSGKVRIKQRSMLNEYGIPVATCQTELTQSCYVEWQIGYDVVTKEKEKLNLTTLKDFKFIGANGKEKALYELSEYVYYMVKWNFIPRAYLRDLEKFLVDIPKENLFDLNSELSIKRSNFIEKEFNGINFLQTKVEYPLIVHKFGKYEIITEITIKEKQRAVGVMPMLYLCFPITELKTEPILLGRKARSKEEAEFIVNKDNADIFLQLLRLFGMLSENHRKDVLHIIDVILKGVCHV
ncbi:MAG: R.Pab1 family restriction endonuclease [Fibromonadaceae bacterium]|jgi:hypothetical protein|nr:R.Pab1 family restriction endonuclease [Fibromonadaceae bacterium]